MTDICFKQLVYGAKSPTRSSTGDAGYDLYSSEHVKIPAAKFGPLAFLKAWWTGDYSSMYPGLVKVHTGISINMPREQMAGFIYDRSGLGSKGLHRFAGLIDSSYTGEIMVVLVNFSSEDFYINRYDRIAQIVFQDVINQQPYLIESDGKKISERGSNGFGSTGN